MNQEKIYDKNLWYSFYLVPRNFIEKVIEKYGKDDLFFRDIYNYRNLSKNDEFKEFNLRCPFDVVYNDFPKEVIDEYINSIGKDKFKKCLSDESMCIETIFDENDSFIDCFDMLYAWNRRNEIFPDVKSFHYYDFEHFIMEKIEDLELKRSELFYIIREHEKTFPDY